MRSDIYIYIYIFFLIETLVKRRKCGGRHDGRGPYILVCCMAIVCSSARCFHTPMVPVLVAQNPSVHRTYKQHFELWNIVVVVCSQMFPFIGEGHV